MIDLYIINPSDNAIFGNNGTGMDVVYDQSGKLQTISGAQRLAQSLQKMLITTLTQDVNKVGDFGTYLPKLRGEKLDPFFIKPFIVTTISDGLASYKNMQQQLSNELEIPDDEMYRGVVKIQVQDVANDPRVYAITVAVQNEKQEEINVVLSLSKG